jgi:hypothetical protein
MLYISTTNTWIKTYRLGIVLNCLFVFFQLPKSETSVAEEISFGSINLYGLGKIFYRLLRQTLFIVADPSVVIAISIIGVNL